MVKFNSVTCTRNSQVVSQPDIARTHAAWATLTRNLRKHDDSNLVSYKQE